MQRRAVLALVIVLAALLAVTAAGPTPAAALSCGPCPATTTADLNLRAGPSLSATILRVIPVGAEIAYAPGEEQGGFVPVVYDGTEGWSHRDYVEPIPINARTTTDWLNLRAAPSLDAEILAVMPPGTVVFINGAAEGFASVTYGQLSGWAHTDYLVSGTGA